MVKLFSYFALLIFAFIIMPAQAQTGLAGSSWPTPRHDMQLTGRAPLNGPNMPILQWTLGFGSGPLIAPTIGSDGTIYVPGNVNDTLYAVAPEGRLLWTFTGKKLAQEEFVAPAVVGRDGVIYFGSTQNVFYAVNPDGALRWSVQLEGAIRYAANIGNDGAIYVATKDGYLYAITPAGKIKWQFNIEHAPGNGTAISSDGTIYVVAGELLHGVGPDGARRLRIDCSDLGLLTGLMIDDFELIYVTGEIPRVRVFSNSAALRWQYDFPASFGAPRLPGLGKDRSAYFVSSKSGEIFVLNHNGTKHWSRTPATTRFLTELVLDDANQLYVVDDNIGLMAMTSAGEMRWNLPEVHCQFSPAFGADGTIYIASDKKLYAISSRAAKLAVDTASLDWGEICAGNAAARTFKISNAGSADLKVNNISVTNVSFQVEPANFILPPGAQRAVQVNFLPTDFVAYAGTLTINSDAGNATVALKGAGIGAKIAAVSESLQFGDVIIGKSATQLAQIVSAGVCEVRIDSVKATGAYSVMAANFPRIITRNDTAKIEIRLSPAVLGGQRATLLVHNNDKQRNPLVIALNGNSVSTRPEIEVTPLALEFGKTCNAIQAYTVVANLGDQLLRIDSLVSSNAAFATNHAKTFTVAVGQRDTIRVRFQPVAGAESSGALTIFSDDTDEKSVAVSLRGAGGVPDIAGLTEIDFGVVDVQTCAGLANFSTRTYAIRNDGSCELKIDSLVVAGVFSLAAPFAAQKIPAGGSLNVPLKFTPIATGDQTGKLRIVSNDPEARSLVVVLRGRGVASPDIAVAGDTLDFGAVAIGSQTLAAIKIRNLGELNLTVTSLTVSSSRFSIPTQPFALACKQDSSVAVAFAPDSVGVFTATLTIRSNDPREPAVSIFLRGLGTKAVRPEIAVTPLALEFGQSCNVIQAHVVVANLGDQLLSVEALVFSNSAFTTTHAPAFTVAPGKSDTIRVRFQPVAGAESSGALTIFSNDDDEKSVAVKLRGAGGAPDIAGLTELDFGVVDVQTCAGLANFSTRTYAVRNDGSCELQIDSLAVAGVFSLAAPFAAQKIPAGGSLNVPLKFTPIAAGDQTGKLRVVSNDPEARSLLVVLRGRGVAAPDIAVAGDTLDFGAVAIGSQKPAAIQIRNLGELNLTVTSFIVSSSRFTVAARQLALACKQDSSVTIIFAPDLMGILTATLTIQSNDPDEAAVKIFLRGHGTKSVEPLIAAAAEYRFPALCIGRRDSLRAVITNIGGGLLSVDSVRLQTNQQIFSLATAGFSLESQQSKTLLVFFKPARRTEYTATAQIFSDASNGRVFAFGLRGSGSGPEISGRKALAFAPTPKDSARRDSYLVNNRGDCSLHLTSVVIEGDQANDFKVIDAGAKVIAPADSSRVTLEFKPASVSAREATLVILSSDPAQPRLAIALTGAGNGAPGKLAGPTSIDFGKACFDEKVTRECTLTNTGESDFRITRLITVRGEVFKINGAIQLPKLLRPEEAISIALAFSPKTSGAVDDTLLAQTDLANGSLLRVVLKGEGREDMSRLTFSHQALAFNGHLDEAKTELITITNTGCSRHEINQIELARKLRVFAFRPQSPLPVRLESMQSLNVQVSFKGDDFRAFADSLYIYCVDSQQNRECMRVSLTGKVMDGAPCLQTAFSKLDFGEVAVGQMKRLDLEVTNCSDSSRIVVRAIQPVNGDFRVLRDTLRIFPRNPQFFAVNFAPRRNGEIVDTLKLVYYSVSDPSRRQTERIALRGAATGNRAFALPNAFTPNGDEKNDVAKILFSGYDPASLVLRVFDLRGLEVRLLRSERRGELEIHWDGRDDRGKLQMPGAYLWLLEDNGKKVGSGQLVLIR